MILSLRKLRKVFIVLILLILIFVIGLYGYRAFGKTKYVEGALTKVYELTGVKKIGKIVYPMEYSDSVIKYSAQNNVDPYLVFSVIKAESNFSSNALSHKKAMGLMQITQDTGNWAAQKMKLDNFDVRDLYDPDTNIRIGCWYLRYLTNQFEKENLGGEDNMDFVIASYNGGRSNVKKWINSIEKNGKGAFIDSITFKETRNYLKKVKDNIKIYKELYDS